MLYLDDELEYIEYVGQKQKYKIWSGKFVNHIACCCVMPLQDTFDDAVINNTIFENHCQFLLVLRIHLLETPCPSYICSFKTMGSKVNTLQQFVRNNHLLICNY